MERQVVTSNANGTEAFNPQLLEGVSWKLWTKTKQVGRRLLVDRTAYFYM
jgi:hypothetical protein